MEAYAIIQAGGKQYKVSAGDVVDVEITSDIAVDSGTHVFSEVLFSFDGKEVKLGTPLLSKASVIADILGCVKGPKVTAYKYKKRKNYHRKLGHRQNYVRMKIRELSL
ncbi:50S ribosomal protein L21 [Chlamydiifrater phoenicopteri]|uniref:50S ribosomal protein L21 n=1 Tax=Chlamydiifrater phoenicopteri TaxID=2681469 RepID=UPI001BCEDF1E|nr:50S ribosomal protein L21 [Chlamydiifrater phoenicopteri]